MGRKPTGKGRSMYIPQGMEESVAKARAEFKRLHGLGDVEIVDFEEPTPLHKLKLHLTAAQDLVAQLETNEKKK
jgi:hypothetical protein